MSQHPDDKRRRVIPRWRPFKVAAGLEQLGPARASGTPPPELSPGEIEALQDDWRRNPSVLHASGLLDAAFVVGRPDVALDAPEFLLANGDELTARMARALISSDVRTAIDGDPMVLSRDARYRRIAAARRLLARSPRDAVLLVDIARDYAILGQALQAERALRRAIYLAPDNRFVLRSAARFFLHRGKEDYAHHILLSSARTRYDPWLLAAEVATAGFAGRVSRWVKVAGNMIQRGSFEPRHISELAGVLGTLEFEAGSTSKTRRLFATALVDPTENTVAQAGWIARHMREFHVITGEQQAPRAFEAGAWEHFLRQQYEVAVEMARKWLHDEPFATRPALFGSWVASTALDDFDAAADLADAARQANPDDPRPLAQLVFCHASAGRIVQADESLRSLEQLLTAKYHGPEAEEWQVVLPANRGLIAYRRGSIEVGRQHYEEASRRAATLKRRDLAAGALVYMAREEARVNPAEAEAVVAEARTVLSAWPAFMRPVYERVLDNASRRAVSAGDAPRRA